MARVFADAGALIREGLDGYVREVTGRTFPGPENWFGMKDEEYDELVRLLG
jgi:ketopantoate hydroxymethyltransferase